MSRLYSSYTTNEDITQLERLADKSLPISSYQQAMMQLGESIGTLISDKIANPDALTYIACTVEDADYLATGLLTTLQTKVSKVAIACFWNQRFSPFEIKDLKVAPIIKEYKEPVTAPVGTLVIAKSIISSGCVVKTNLMHLIDSTQPEQIIIAAPVLYQGAQSQLTSSFPAHIADKFDLIYLAEDDERLPTGEVVPGVGGMVYERLGFSSQEDKNRYTPNIVKSRRRELVS